MSVGTRVEVVGSGNPLDPEEHEGQRGRIVAIVGFGKVFMVRLGSSDLALPFGAAELREVDGE